MVLSRGVWRIFGITLAQYRRTLDAHALLDFSGVLERAVALLKEAYPDRPTAAERIAAGFTEFYRTSQPAAYAAQRARVEAGARAVAALYERNVFPEMRVAWGTYPNNIGHDDSLGCFRCHDDKHKAADGRTLTQDCEACHVLLAQEETNPKVLSDLGLAPGGK